MAKLSADSTRLKFKPAKEEAGSRGLELAQGGAFSLS